MSERTADPIGLLGWLWRFAFGAIVLAAVAFWISSAAAVAVPAGSGAPVPWVRLAISGFQSFAMLGMACLLLLRASSNHAAVLLSAILLVQGYGPPAPSEVEWVAQAGAGLSIAVELIIGFAWPVFCLEISGGKADRRQARLVPAAAVLFAAAAALIRTAQIFDLPGYSPLLYPAFVITHQAFGYALIGYNYRRNDAAARNRIEIVVLAFLCLLVGVVLVNWSPGIWESMVLAALRIVAAGLLAYALLRHRLFDLGFVLNRTLVYGAVSFVLLAGFGLAEWAIKHTLPPELTKESAFYSAGIALGLFLSFHRLRDWIDLHFERLFFHAWHVNEATLRQFVASASAYKSRQALYRAFAGEVSRFSGAPAALYVSDDEGGYCRAAGRLPGVRPRYPADERLLAILSTERSAVEPSRAHSDVPGALALPMLDQGTLAGFVLVAARADGTRFRPDEVEVLGWAVEHVGRDLRALQARELVSDNERLSAELATLTRERDRLLALLTPAEVHELRA